MARGKVPREWSKDGPLASILSFIIGGRSSPRQKNSGRVEIGGEWLGLASGLVSVAETKRGPPPGNLQSWVPAASGGALARAEIPLTPAGADPLPGIPERGIESRGFDYETLT